MKIQKIVLAVVFGLFLSAGSVAETHPQISLVKNIVTGDKKGTEILSIQAASNRMAVSNSKKGIVDIYSIAPADNPVLIKRIKLQLEAGEQVTSVAFHPDYNYILAAIQAASPVDNGRVEVRNPDTGSILNKLAAGVGPDAVVIAPAGNYAMVANEAEEFVFDPKTKTFSSAKGSVTLLKLDKQAEKITATQIELPDLSGHEGFVSESDHRFIERKIDWNKDGKITEEDVDLNANGAIDKEKLVLGTFHGVPVKAKEKNGEMFLFPLNDNESDLLEPEYVAFSDDGSKAWVNLQESNGVIVIDTEAARIIADFGLGTTTHMADIKDDGKISLNTRITALREPDVIIMSKDGKYLITADEGDTDPKASKTRSGVIGGGRTVSVFDAQSGKLLGDTASQIDEKVAAAGFYPDSRSDNKGSEPEMLTSFVMDGVEYVVAGLERANGVALISIANPEKPEVINVAAIDKNAKAGKVAPEGVVHYYDEKMNVTTQRK